MSNEISTPRTNLLMFSSESIEAQGRNDRDYLTHRVKLLLDVKEQYPMASFSDLAHVVNIASDPCGRGCCCCCNTLVVGADVINPNPVY
jgi:hypothetical protein